MFDFENLTLLTKTARSSVVPDIAPPRGRTYLVDTNGEQTRRITKTPILGKESEVACGARYSPAFGSSDLRVAQHPKQGARSGATGDRSVSRFRSLRQHERN